MLQNNREEWQMMFFVSQKLHQSEMKYTHVEKEVLAIAQVCENFDCLLVGTKFEVKMDHKPLVKFL